MFLRNLKRVSNDYTGAIDRCTPFLCRYSGKESLSEAIRGNAKDYTWDSVSVEEARDLNPAILMYVKHININNRRRSINSIYNISAIKGILENNGRPIIRASIRGILINPILFLKEKYKCDSDTIYQFETDDTIHIKHLNASISGCVLRGRFDLRTCSYYCH